VANVARDRWSALVKEWRRSGLAAKDFAAKKRLKAQTLKWWAWRLGAKKRVAERVEARVGPLSFIEVTPAAHTDVVESRLEIVVARGRRISVPSTFDADHLRRLIAVLEST
jgi:hypothetical protein